MRVDDIFGIGSAYQVRDNTGVAAGAGCTAISANEVRCSRLGISTIRLELGPGNDNATVATVGSERAEIYGQDGQDVMISMFGNDLIDGGAGDDQADAAQGDDTLLGGSGNDLLIGSLGNDTLDGGDGDDKLQPSLGTDVVYGGAGSDEASYAGFVDAVAVSLNDIADDGPAGENDNIHSDVENVVGGTNADVLVGDELGNRLSGGPGADSIDGAGGADVMLGEAGSDKIEARDGAVDTVNCGSETDTLNRDVADVATECENITPAATGGAPLPSTTPPSTTPPNATPQGTTTPPVFRRRSTRMVLTSVPARDRRAPFSYKIRGSLRPTPAYLPLTCTGVVALRLRRGNATLAHVNVAVSRETDTGPNCKFAGTLKITNIERRPRSGIRLTVDARYAGSNYNEPSNRVARTVTAG